MPHTTAPEQSPKSNLDNTNHEQLKNATEHSQGFFLIEFATLSTDVSEGITTCLDIIEANEIDSDSSAKSLNQNDCEALQKLALTSARLLGEYAVQELEWITTNSRALGKTRRTDLKAASEAYQQEQEPQQQNKPQNQ